MLTAEDLMTTTPEEPKPPPERPMTRSTTRSTTSQVDRAGSHSAVAESTFLGGKGRGGEGRIAGGKVMLTLRRLLSIGLLRVRILISDLKYNCSKNVNPEQHKGNLSSII
jgi:hypothetical protein